MLLIGEHGDCRPRTNSARPSIRATSCSSRLPTSTVLMADRRPCSTTNCCRGSGPVAREMVDLSEELGFALCSGLSGAGRSPPGACHPLRCRQTLRRRGDDVRCHWRHGQLRLSRASNSYTVHGENVAKAARGWAVGAHSGLHRHRVPSGRPPSGALGASSRAREAWDASLFERTVCHGAKRWCNPRATATDIRRRNRYGNGSRSWSVADCTASVSPDVTRATMTLMNGLVGDFTEFDARIGGQSAPRRRGADCRRCPTSCTRLSLWPRPKRRS